VRPFNFIRRLAQKHEVTVLCVATNDSDYRAVAELRPHCQAVEVFPLSVWQSLWNCLVGVLSSRAIRNAYFYSARLRQCLAENIARGDADLVHAEHLKSAPMVEDVVGKVPIVFDAVDCISTMEGRRRKVFHNPLLKLFFWTEQKKMMHWETWASEHFDRLIISSAVDKESYPHPPGCKEKMHVVQNSVDLDRFRPGQFEPHADLVVFCGNLYYFPNEDAALYFSRTVWPLLLARKPNLRLQIVGNNPPRSVKQLEGKNNIRVVGSVPDVRPHLGRARVAVCPVRVRAGTQNKILEAMAMGVPVVAHRICCEGLAVESGKHLLTADTPEEFASGVESLFEDSSLRNILVQAGREYVETHHDWNRSVEELLAVYSEALADFAGEAGNGARAARDVPGDFSPAKTRLRV